MVLRKGELGGNMSKTLAVKYRPQTFEDVVEQDAIKLILQQQLKTRETKNAYLFCGPAGDGKTTTARIFANEINGGEGNPIEMDAASNSGVEDVRNISQQARTKSMDSEYKVFIIDECHSISNTGWQAFLKLIEEPPAKSIFIFCTTDPQKIPKTILSRVQRYDFQRISQQGIVDRLEQILAKEGYKPQRTISDKSYFIDAVEYIAKIADGGMRDAISLMDKCLAYSSELTLENVVEALGTVNYTVMSQLSDNILSFNVKESIEILNSVYSGGKDLKQFLKQYTQFILDVLKRKLGCDWKYLNIPHLNEYETWIDSLNDTERDILESLLGVLVRLNSEIKYSSTPKYDIEAELLLFMEDVK